MRLLKALAFSIALHVLLILAFAELEALTPPRKVPTEINISFVNVSREKEVRYRAVKKKLVEKNVRKEASKPKVVKRKPPKRMVVKKQKRTAPEPKRERQETERRAEREPSRRAKAEAPAKEESPVRNSEPLLKEAPAQGEPVEEISPAEMLSYALPPDTPVGIGEEEEEEEASYEEEYTEENLYTIREIIQGYLSYPTVARRMGWEGTVVVRFVLTPEGVVEEKEVEESSGFEVLDKNALKVIELASKDFPKPEETVVVVVPIVYKLE